MSLREKVEMREAAARAEAAAAAIGTALNGDQKLVSLLQEWATLRDSRAALRRAVVVEEFHDERYESVGLTNDDRCVLFQVVAVELTLQKLCGTSKSTERVFNFVRQLANHLSAGAVLYQ